MNPVHEGVICRQVKMQIADTLALNTHQTDGPKIAESYSKSESVCVEFNFAVLKK